jgi:hypothetical protein
MIRQKKEKRETEGWKIRLEEGTTGHRGKKREERKA